MKKSRDTVRLTNLELEAANRDLQIALRAKGDFLAVTSHEIRTPLNGIMGIAEILRLEKGLPERVMSRLDVLYKSGVAMRDLVDDLLDASKAATSKVVPDVAVVNIRELLDEAVRTWMDSANAKGLRLELACELLSDTVATDGPKLRQVVLNLISNAVKFTDRGVVRVSASSDAERLTIAISDTGIGIAPQDQERIFDVFTQVDMGLTRRFSGVGLGLSISRQIVLALGGNIRVESIEGEGATFTIDLPVSASMHVEQSFSADPVPVGEATVAKASLVALEPNPLSAALLRASARAVGADIEIHREPEDLLAALSLTGRDLVLVSAAQMAAKDEVANEISAWCASNGSGLVLIVGKGDDDMAAVAGGAYSIFGELRSPVSSQGVGALLDAMKIGISQVAAEAIETAVA